MDSVNVRAVEILIHLSLHIVQLELSPVHNVQIYVGSDNKIGKRRLKLTDRSLGCFYQNIWHILLDVTQVSKILYALNCNKK